MSCPGYWTGLVLIATGLETALQYSNGEGSSGIGYWRWLDQLFAELESLILAQNERWRQA